MRTIKGLLCAAALVASIGASMAQSNVYSLNVVGYVNLPVLANHWYLIGNPLSAGDNTAVSVLTNLTASVGDTVGWDQSQIYQFDPVTGWGSGNDVYFSDGGFGWYPYGDTLKDLTPGKGVWFYPTSSGTVTFVGTVMTTNKFQVVGGGKYNMVASAFPAAQSLHAMGLLGQSNLAEDVNDVVLRHDAVRGWDQSSLYYNSYGWYGSDWDNNSYDPAGPTLNVGEAVFYLDNNGTANWTQTFTIN